MADGHLLYTEEDVDGSVAAILRADLRSYTWERLVKVVLDSLSSSGRLLPPGSETREEWATQFANSSGQGYAIVEVYEGRAEADRMTDYMASLGPRQARTMRRIAAYGPWSPSVPDTKEET